MSFESLRSLEIEYDAALEQNDRDYARQVGYNIMEWSLRDADYGTLFATDEVSKHKSCNSLECEGACRLFAEWCVEHDFESDAQDAYDNLSGERDDGWTTMDDYEFTENTDLTCKGCMVNGSCVFVEVWYQDTKVGFIRIN